jgi:hypothetical protein
MPKHKDAALVNAKEKEHSTLTLIDVGLDLKVWKLTGDVEDKKNKGLWHAVQLTTGKKMDELRLLLTCVKGPRDKDRTPDSGTLTITLTDGSATKVVDPPPPVDYANDPPPPP